MKFQDGVGLVVMEIALVTIVIIVMSQELNTEMLKRVVTVAVATIIPTVILEAAL